MPSVASAKEGGERGRGEGGDWLNFRAFSEIVPVPFGYASRFLFYCSTVLLLYSLALRGGEGEPQLAHVCRRNRAEIRHVEMSCLLPCVGACRPKNFLEAAAEKIF